MNLYETELWARDPVRLGTWLQGRVPDPDVEAKRATA